MAAEVTTRGDAALVNFRDLHEAFPSILAGRVYRTACPVRATEEDVVQLQKQMGVDLRSAEEMKGADGELPVLLRGAQTFTYTRAVSSWSSFWQVQESVQPGNSAVEPCMRLHHVALLDRERYKMALFMKMPFASVASALAVGVWDQAQSRRMLIEQINKGGLEWLYEILLEASGPEICTTLNVVLEELRSLNSGGVMFFCKVGKDRTGLIAACLLGCAGASDEQIVRDYARSDGMGEMALGGLEQKKEMEGLDLKVFGAAPASAMSHILAWVRTKHGSLSAYMEHIGFTHSLQAQLRDQLTGAGVQPGRL